MLTAKSFNLVSLLPQVHSTRTLTQDECPEVRHGFIEALKRALTQGSLSQRWYTLCFLAAFEPSEQVKEFMVRWLKLRAVRYRTFLFV
jgi:hypothetical protein